MKPKLIDLWRTSSLIQGALALITAAAIVYLAIAEKQIPEILVATLGTILGFYFGTKKSLI